VERSSATGLTAQRHSTGQHSTGEDLRRATPALPGQAAASVKADVEKIKERVHHERG